MAKSSEWAEAAGVFTGLAVIIWEFNDKSWLAAQQAASLAHHTDPGIAPIITPIIAGGLVWMIVGLILPKQKPQ